MRPSDTPPTDSQEELHVLVVDPDAWYAENMRTALEQHHHVVAAVDTVAGAVDTLQGHTYDVAIIDEALPGRTELDLSLALQRARPETAVVLVSERRLTVAEIVACFDAGADEYIEKPFHPVEFVARVGAVARRVRRAAEPGRARDDSRREFDAGDGRATAV